MLGSSEEVGILLLSRFLQGLSTAVVWTVGLALTKDTVSKDEVGQCMGTAISANSVGLVISPMLGGIVYEHAGLWGVLGMMIGLVILNIILVVLMIEKRVAKKYVLKHKTPYVNGNGIGNGYGTVEHASDEDLAIESHSAIEDANNDSETFAHLRSHNEASPPPPYPGNQARLSSITSVKSLFQTPKEGWLHKFPILRFFRSARILTDAYGVFTQFGLLASFDAFLPLFVERRFGWNSLGAGLIFLTIAVPALLGPVAGKLSDRFGPRRVAFAGCILTAPPLVCIRLVGYDNDTRHVVLLCVLLTLIGIFLTLIISPLAADMSFAVDQIERDHPGAFGENGAYGQAYAFFNIAMAAACVVGSTLR